MNPRLKIDSHLHCNFRGFNTLVLQDYIRLNNLKQIWLLSWEECYPSYGSAYTNLPPEEIYQVLMEIEDFGIGFYAPDPRLTDASERLTFWKNKGFKGCGELKVRCNWKSKEVDKLLDTANNLEMPVIFHMENESETLSLENSRPLDNAIGILCKLSYRLSAKRKNIVIHILRNLTSRLISIVSSTKQILCTRKKKHEGYLNDISGLEKMLLKYPSLKFVGHGPDFWSSIQSDAMSSDEPNQSSPIVKLLSNHENLYADLSAKSGFNALKENRTYTSNLLEKFKEKLLYGTDNFSLGLDDLIDGLEISEHVKNKVFFSNANSFFDN